MGNPEAKKDESGSQVFKGSGFWASNVRMATYAGIGGAIVMSVQFGIVFWMTERLKIKFLMIGMELSIIVFLLYSFLGDGIATYPYAITIEHGKGLRLSTPFKEIYIPIENIKDVRAIAFGFAVRLKRRHRLLTEFVIHSFFGKAWAVADAIRAEIHGRDRGAAF
jgi:hypothetical protein